jgi:hypothetical protein
MEQSINPPKSQNQFTIDALKVGDKLKDFIPDPGCKFTDAPMETRQPAA